MIAYLEGRMKNTALFYVKFKICRILHEYLIGIDIVLKNHTSRNHSQMCMQACPFGSLLAGIKLICMASLL